VRPRDHRRLLSRREFLGASASIGALALAASGARAASPRPTTAAGLDAVVSCAIHPGVGIARVGDSEDAFYIGPEVPLAVPDASTTLKDATGAVARQAARFRVYGYDAEGRVVAELTAPSAAIEWSVHLANRKASWYQFDTALDIPEAGPAPRRNRAVIGSARAQLVGDGGPSVAPAVVTAAIMDVPVTLGELLVDVSGRLVVLAGPGAAQAWAGARLTTFANNDGWLDDIADGPVRATVQIGNRIIEARPAWVATAPPNFAPAIAAGWRTLHDVLEDAWVDAGLVLADERTDFRRHILPLFARLSTLQWVNAGLLRDYGWQSPSDFTDPGLVARLADPSEAGRAFRTTMAARFRDLASEESDPRGLPPILGDAVAFPANSPRQWIGPTDLQLRRLADWADGRFDSEGGADPPVGQLEDLSLAEQPAALDRGALEACLGDAFHPGCELTWPVRRASMWEAPYRLAVRPDPEPDFGDSLSPEAALAPDGPLSGSFPGSLSRWMAVPWMTDTSSCRSGYQPTIDPYLETFWPARVPNQVLAEADYLIVMDRDAPIEARLDAFRRRRDWLRGVARDPSSLTDTIGYWTGLGMVAELPGPGDESFPARFAVEVERTLPEPPSDT
jgi:hypothetical protein